MKNLIILINVAVIIGIATIFTRPEDLKPNAPSANKNKLSGGSAKVSADFAAVTTDAKPQSEPDEFVAEFIREMAEARLMDLEEGKIAEQRGTTKDLKSYGSLMVTDQTEMLHEIKKLAKLKKISLPGELGPDKAEGLMDLKGVHGAAFDKKFVKMMTIDHKRDVKKFEKATRSSDADVQVFATRYLPYVEAHLKKIKGLK